MIIPAAHAAQFLSSTIAAVRGQDYPNLGEIIVAASDNESAEAALAAGARVVDNPTGNTPAGLNRALQASDGEIVARVDAQSTIPAGYLSQAVSTLESSGADTVGGMQIPIGTTRWERAISAAMSSPFGAGDASYRIGGVAGPTDTVYLGVFRRTVLTRLGGYDESFIRNQDYELNHRIRESGGVVWFDPELKVAYHPRGSLADLARQYFQYGLWKRKFSRRHPGSLRWRQLAPPTAVIGLVVTLLASIWLRPLWLVPAAYLASLVVIGLAQIRRIGLAGLGVPPALATMHLSWGLGFLLG